GLDDIAHEAGRVPVRRIRLGCAVAVCAPDHEGAGAPFGDGEMRFPLTKAIFTLILAKLCRLPGLAAIRREIDLGDPGVAAERYAAGERERARPHRRIGFEIR